MKRKYRKRTEEDYKEMSKFVDDYLSKEKKLHKLISVQEKLIELLSDYYRRTENICELNRIVQEEMFSVSFETLECLCCEEPHYPIQTFIHHYEYISKNYESTEFHDDIDLHLKPTQLFEKYYRHSDVHPSDYKFHRHKKESV